MCARIAIVYNKPEASRYSAMGEEGAVNGVLEAVKAVNVASGCAKINQVPVRVNYTYVDLNSRRDSGF